IAKIGVRSTLWVRFQPRRRLTTDAVAVRSLPADAGRSALDRLTVLRRERRIAIGFELGDQANVVALRNEAGDKARAAREVDQRVNLLQMRQDEVQGHSRMTLRNRGNHAGTDRLPRLVPDGEIEGTTG